ncbi:uncharacterized protein N0V89_004634 [Didymosphaeria variabile]|uniref:NmrA-like domain-containing protein n=1 Tax=Didymosphaeria variabile TaxID=1932322 RepID=A0A9W8XQ93_9PLEO|nr:uncharacterized protein N0V89_004634 [Didymosphaeria variabile]KAJ4356599.1 hypothetical protein N0V89_004634 [Didymosphaeria variabile]
MPKILAVFGATGQQGSSVIHHVLQNPSLRTQYTIRALTRDVDSPSARNLQERDIEVLPADILDRASLDLALQGVHTVFAMTPPYTSASALPSSSALTFEFENGKRIADAALAAGVAFFIFSTLPSVSEISHGKYTSVAPFDGKAKAEAYIRGLAASGMDSAFICPGSFMENFTAQRWSAPRKGVDGVWAVFLGGVEEMAPFEGLKDFLEEVYRYAEEFGGILGGEEENVRWAVESVGGRSELTSLEKFLEKYPYELGD